MARRLSPTTPGRCARCLLPTRFCVCAEVPAIATRTELLVIRHALEAWKPSNTGRLAALALRACTLVDHGVDRGGGAGPAIDLASPGTWLLYPDAAAAPPSAGAACRRLVVLDGSWPQARRMLQRIPGLAALPRLALPSPAAPPDRLRRAPDPCAMSTLEAIAAAVALLEGDALARPLTALNALFVARSRAAHGDPRPRTRRRATLAPMQARLEDLVRRFRADTGSIHMIENGVLLLRAQVGLPRHVAQIVAAVPIGKGMTGLAAQRNAPVASGHLQRDSDPKIARGARDTGVNGALVVPIRDESGAVRGTLGIGVHQEYEYTAAETARLLVEAATLLR